ncbi:hypothetical protein ACWCPF_34600 [Streptomyces sp. NPDC001858]
MAGFAEVWDAWHDRPPPGADPVAWTGIPPLTPHDELPHLRRVVAESTAEPPDALFETVVAMLIAGIDTMLRQDRRARTARTPPGRP